MLTIVLLFLQINLFGQTVKDNIFYPIVEDEQVNPVAIFTGYKDSIPTFYAGDNNEELPFVCLIAENGLLRYIDTLDAETALLEYLTPYSNAVRMQ